jgi:hypothetical protein
VRLLSSPKKASHTIFRIADFHVVFHEISVTFTKALAFSDFLSDENSGRSLRVLDVFRVDSGLVLMNKRLV